MISKNCDYINDIEGIFDNCKNLEIVKINGFNLGSNITSLRKLFLNLPKLIKIDIDAFNINYVEDFSYMFANSNIKNIKLKINTNSANNMAHIEYPPVTENKEKIFRKIFVKISMNF